MARQQAKLTVQRAEVTRAVAARDPNHAAPRAQRVKLLEDEVRVLMAEAMTLEKEAERLLVQARPPSSAAGSGAERAQALFCSLGADSASRWAICPSVRTAASTCSRSGLPVLRRMQLR
jgi:hypothetical protein